MSVPGTTQRAWLGLYHGTPDAIKNQLFGNLAILVFRASHASASCPRADSFKQGDRGDKPGVEIEIEIESPSERLRAGYGAMRSHLSYLMPCISDDLYGMQAPWIQGCSADV